MYGDKKKNRLVVPGCVGRDIEGLQISRKNFRDDGNLLKLECNDGCKILSILKTYLKQVNFMVYKSYFSKAVYTVLYSIFSIVTYTHTHKHIYADCYTCTHKKVVVYETHIQLIF